MPDEIKTSIQDSLQKEPTSEGKVETTPTYTEEQVNEIRLKVKNDTLAEAGRLRKPLEEKTSAYETQLAKTQSQLKEAQDEAAELRRDMEALNDNDPNQAGLKKRLSEWDKKISSLKEKEQKLDDGLKQFGEDIKLVQDYKRNETIQKIASEYDKGNPDTLKALCDRLDVTSPEKIRLAAESIWLKKSEVPSSPQPGVKPDSGKTTGGGARTFKEIQAAYIANPSWENTQALIKAKQEQGIR